MSEAPLPPPPPPARPTSVGRTLVIVGGVAVAIGLAAALSRNGSRNGAYESNPLLRVVIAAAVMGLVGAFVVGALRYRGRNNEATQHATAPHRVAPWILSAAALAALVALATAPRLAKGAGGFGTGRPAGGSGAGRTQQRPGGKGDFGSKDKPTEVEIGDKDGDGQLDTTYSKNGSTRYLQQCPPDATHSVPPLDPGVTPIDVDCDGTIDGFARIKLSKQVDRDGDGKIDDGWNQAPLNRSTPRSTTTTTARPQSESSRTDLGRLLKIVALVAACIALVTAIVMILRDRAGRPKKPKPDPEPPTLDQAVADLSEALLVEPDPRRAIIDAYARLLQVLAAAGHPRFSYEGPREHLTRALRNLDVRPSAASTLVELFEIARFSNHPLGEAERALALQALSDVQADMQAGRQAADEGRELVTSP